MAYKYYVQEYAKQRADSILPVPESYPLRGDFGSNFIPDFSELTEILRKIYLDIAENPEAYECELYPLNQDMRGKGVDNESKNSLDCVVNCLRILCDCGEIENHLLRVNAENFNKQIKKVKNHSAVIAKLNESGFFYQSSIYDKKAGSFLVEYPSLPNIMNVLKIYMDCWTAVLNDEYIKSEIKKNGYGWIGGYYGYHLFDYKVTANPKELNPMQLIRDNSYNWDEESRKIYINFYEYSLNYPAIRFSDGNYYLGKKRICVFRYDDNQIILKLKLKNPGKYIQEIEKLPVHLQACFSERAWKCRNCGGFGGDPEKCGNRIYWKHNGTDYIGCSMNCFYFNSIKDEDLPCLFSLLEHEYKSHKL